MHQLGQTRSVHRRDHALFTPDTFVRAALPGMKRATAIIHTAPAIGAGFTQYTAELESEGSLGELPASSERFLFVIEGKVSAEFSQARHTLAKNDYAYIPVGLDHSVAAVSESKLAIIEKRYIPLAGVEPPAAFAGRASSVAAEPLEGDDAIAVRHLLPDVMAFDCAVNLM